MSEAKGLWVSKALMWANIFYVVMEIITRCPKPEHTALFTFVACYCFKRAYLDVKL